VSPARSEVNRMTVFNSNKVDTKKQPMFFGQPLGVQRYDNYKYPVFDRLTQQQLGYFWRPEEVSLHNRMMILSLMPTSMTQVQCGSWQKRGIMLVNMTVLS
jgi:hypothetical protein